jgi:hypothetical protein
VKWNKRSKTARWYSKGIEPYIHGNFSAYPAASGWQTSKEHAATTKTLQENRIKGLLNNYESAYTPPGNYSRGEREIIAKRASANPQKFNRELYAKSVIPPKEVMMARLHALKHGPPPSRNAPLPPSPSPSPSPKKFNAFKLSPLAKLAKISVSEFPKGLRFLSLPKKTRHKTRRTKQ